MTPEERDEAMKRHPSAQHRKQPDDNLGLHLAGTEAAHLLLFAAGIANKGHLDPGDAKNLYLHARNFVHALEAAEPTAKHIT